MSFDSLRPLVVALAFAAIASFPLLGQALEDRCAAKLPNGHPAYCSPAAEGLAPIWNAPLCCEGSACTRPGSGGRCPTGKEAFWCEFAERRIDGSLTCLFEVPDICSVDVCPPADTGEPLFLCCPGNDFDSCFEYWPGLECDMIWYCAWGATNEDGTYYCAEPENY